MSAPKGLDLSTKESKPKAEPLPVDTLTPEQREVVAAACRWTGNILAEVLGNLGTKMSMTDRAHLATALRSIREVGL